jgi:glutamine amidotransferase
MIAVVKYNAGNIKSVSNAVERLGYECIITDNPEVITRASKVILPGVGEAGSAMNHLKGLGLDTVIKNLKQPVLGICLGLQILCRHSEEGDAGCMGIFDASVKKLPATGIVPHMGWNSFTTVSGLLLKGINTYDNVYYVHSYCTAKNDSTTALTEYLVSFSAAMERDNFFGVQFHPEKSALTGEKILRNFLEL